MKHPCKSSGNRRRPIFRDFSSHTIAVFANQKKSQRQKKRKIPKKDSIINFLSYLIFLVNYIIFSKL